MCEVGFRENNRGMLSDSPPTQTSSAPSQSALEVVTQGLLAKQPRSLWVRAEALRRWRGVDSREGRLRDCEVPWSRGVAWMQGRRHNNANTGIAIIVLGRQGILLRRGKPRVSEPKVLIKGHK